MLEKPTVLAVANRLEVAIQAYEACRNIYRIVPYIKESSNGYGFIVYTYEPNIEGIKYDLSHLF
jgi:hypothetical protein